LNHEPTAYITGHKEFFGIDFRISPGTLIPRPETELLVEKAIELANAAFPQSCLIADIGTGCGAIAIAIALHLPEVKIYASDISAAALEVARSNCRYHGVRDRITLLHGDLLEPLPEPVHLIVANLPYIRESELPTLPPEISMFEPQIALAGGRDGLKQIERLLSQAGTKLLPQGAIMLEIGYEQGQTASELAKQYIPDARVNVITDLAGLDRLIQIFSTQR
jgi:release factor glutamine methyltransferase